MNTLSLFTPRFTSDLFDVIDRNFSEFEQKDKNRIPAVDFYETKDSYTLKMELSGYSEKDIELNLKDKVLTIKSAKEETKKDEKQEKELFFHIQERKSSSFVRSFTLPEDVDEETVNASMQNGLLSVEIKRKAETQPRKIAINVA